MVQFFSTVCFFTSLVMVQMSAESAKTNGLLEFPAFRGHVWTQQTVLKSLCDCKYRLPHVHLCSGSMFNGLLGTSSMSTLFWFFLLWSDVELAYYWATCCSALPLLCAVCAPVIEFLFDVNHAAVCGLDNVRPHLLQVQWPGVLCVS